MLSLVSVQVREMRDITPRGMGMLTRHYSIFTTPYLFSVILSSRFADGVSEFLLSPPNIGDN